MSEGKEAQGWGRKRVSNWGARKGKVPVLEEGEVCGH